MCDVVDVHVVVKPRNFPVLEREIVFSPTLMGLIVQFQVNKRLC